MACIISTSDTKSKHRSLCLPKLRRLHNIVIAARSELDQIKAIAERISHIGHSPPLPLLEWAIQHRAGILGLPNGGVEVIGDEVEMHRPWPCEVSWSV